MGLMKKFFLPLLLLVAIFSLTYVSINYLSFLQFALYPKSDPGLVDFESFLSNSGRIRSSQNDKDLTIISVDSEEISTDTHPFEPPLIINNMELCKNSPNLDWIAYVYSAIEEFDERLLLRKTWFNTQLFKDFSLKVAFLLGTGSDDIQQKVEEEHDKYHDIVQGDFVDSYNNLTMKGVMGLKWISTYCPNARYAIKADVDTFVNIFEIARLLKENRHKSSLIVCKVWSGSLIRRDPKTCGKWCVKDTDFPGRSTYPQYCSGPFYIISGKVVKSLYESSKSAPHFFIEDVYMTGVLTEKIPYKIDYVNLSWRMIIGSAEQALNSYFEYYVAHHGNRNTLIALWNALLDRLTDSQKALLQQDVSYYKVY